MKTTVSEKGQVTIPKRLRQRLGIRAGQVLDFTEEQGRLIGVKSAGQDTVAEVTGILAPEDGAGTDSFIEEIRGSVLPGEVEQIQK